MAQNGHMEEDEQRPDLGALMNAAATDAKGWYNAQKTYLILSASEKAGRISGILVTMFIVLVLMTGVLMFCSLALAIWLGQLLNNSILGFLSAGGILFISTLLFYFFGGNALRDHITLTMINAAEEHDENV